MIEKATPAAWLFSFLRRSYQHQRAQARSRRAASAHHRGESKTADEGGRRILARKHEAEQGGRHQAGDAGDGAVETGGGAHVVGVDRSHHGGGERRRAAAHAQRHQQGGRQDVCPVIQRAGAEPGVEREAGADDGGARCQRQAAADARRDAARQARGQTDDDGHGQQGGAGGDGAPVLDADQQKRQQHQQAAHRAVDKKSEQGQANEAGRGEHRQGHQGVVAAAVLQPEEGSQQEGAGAGGAPHGDGCTFGGRTGGLGQRPGQEAQSGGGEGRAAPVQRRLFRFTAFRDVAPGQQAGAGRDRYIDQKNAAPAGRIDQPAAQQGTEGAGQRAHGGPGADGPAARFALECAAEDGQAVGHQERGTESLQAPARQQPAETGRGGAQHRGQGEQDQSRHEQAAPAEVVAHAAAQQDQGAQRQQIGIDGPGQLRRPGAEIARQGGQGDVDDGAVDKCHAGAEDGGGQGQPGISRRCFAVDQGRADAVAGAGNGGGHGQVLRAGWNMAGVLGGDRSCIVSRYAQGGFLQCHARVTDDAPLSPRKDGRLS